MGTLLLIIAGFPCTNCSMAGPHEGWVGIQGDESFNFFATPASGRRSQDLRPDICVHLVVENVPMRDDHKVAILKAMGGLSDAHLLVINSKEWTACPRERYWFATFQPSHA